MRTRCVAHWPVVVCAVLALAAGAAAQSSLLAQLGAPAPGAASHAPSSVVAADPPIKLKWKQKKLGKGDYSSIAVDGAGNPHVVYDKTVGAGRVLTHAWAEGSKWFSEPIVADDAQNSIGYDNALALDATGSPRVAYAAYDSVTGWNLWYAHRDVAGWHTEMVDPGGLANSIVVDDQGFAHMVHVEGPGGVRYISQTPTGWDFETIPPGGLYFGGSSLNLHDGKVYVTYSDSSLPRKLFLAVRDTGVWSTEEIDEGIRGSAALDQKGTLHVVYQAESAIELRHAWLGKAGWEHDTLSTHTELFGETLPPAFNCIGEYPALAADGSGRLQLANGVYLSKGNAYTEALLASAFDGTIWYPSVVSSKLIGFENSIAVDPRGVVSISTNKSGGNSTSIVAVRLKGARLQLSVVPKEAGTVSVAPGGTVCSTKATEFFYPGNEVSLTAAPVAGFSFTGWTGAATGTDPDIVVTMGKNQKVVAHFAPSP